MKRALIFWFSGLSGSGKSTVADKVKTLLNNDSKTVLILDGDAVRERLHSNLGFSQEDIKKNNALIAQLCRDNRDKYDVILVPIISPYRMSRKAAGDLLGDGFYLIYFAADLQTVMARDCKGLYAKARNNQIDNMIGYSDESPYEVPTDPDLIIDTKGERVEESVNRLYRFIAGLKVS